MTQREINDKIKQYQDQIDHYNKEIEKLLKLEATDIWVPDDKDTFYSYSLSGITVFDKNVTRNKKDVIESFNYWKTPDEAAYEELRTKYRRKFRKYVEEHSDELDWNNSCQQKYCLSKSHLYDKFVISKAKTVQVQGAIYASSKEILENAINYVSKDIVMRYVL